VYGRAEKSYVPIFIEGRAVPPAFDLHGPLIATLRQHHVPIALGDSSQRVKPHGLSPFDRAALETLSAAVVVPVRRKDTLLAFLCLGRKRSGDVYTPTDLALLTALANKLSAEFLRFKDDEIIRQGHAMQAALRRYVPTPVADQLARWRDLESGEQELSVLFVDIRGYTTYSETRSAEAIFSVVNRYTDAVARVLRQHGGTVVEFSGDGVMAVFGVPEPLPAKERAAVAAARQIVAAVGSLDIKSGELDGTSLSVGVGIATGKAYVGSVQALDRFIWTAIGNTTNLAARLQGLTREFNAAIAIDRGTWQALGDGGIHFEQHENTPIRGRRQPEDVYTLPAAAARAPTS
jgi:class 3 adenylate cyclase